MKPDDPPVTTAAIATRMSSHLANVTVGVETPDFYTQSRRSVCWRRTGAWQASSRRALATG